MKKITLLITLVVSSMTTFAQSFTGPTSVITGTTITLTASPNESQPYYGSTNYEFTGVGQIYDVETTTSNVNDGSYVKATIQSVDNVYANTGSPTTIKIKVTNIYTSPITMTFRIHADYRIGLADYNDQSIPYTITVNPGHPIFAGGNTPVDPGPDGTDGGITTHYLWRIVHLSNNQHLYTADRNEMQNLLDDNGSISSPSWPNPPYRLEGIIGYVYKTLQPGTVALRRYQKNGEHMYTTDTNEANALAGSGWNSEGITGYVPTSSQPGNQLVYRYLATGGYAGHFWTSDFNELGSGNSGWLYEGAAFHILSAPQ